MYPTKKEVEGRLRLINTQLDALVDVETELITRRHKLEAQINLLEDERATAQNLLNWLNSRDVDEEEAFYTDKKTLEFVNINDVL